MPQVDRGFQLLSQFFRNCVRDAILCQHSMTRLLPVSVNLNVWVILKASNKVTILIGISGQSSLEVHKSDMSFPSLLYLLA